jgi:hypothetical protein
MNSSLVVAVTTSLLCLCYSPSGAQPCPDVEQECEHILQGVTCSSTYVYDLLQSFTPAAAPLCAVELNLAVGGPGPTVSITVQIQTSVVPGEGVLSSVTQLHSPSSNQWILFDTPDIILTPGVEYFIYVTSGPNCMWCASLPHCEYPGGTAYNNGEALDYDWSFRTYTDGAVPLDKSSWGAVKARYR